MALRLCWRQVTTKIDRSFRANFCTKKVGKPNDASAKIIDWSRFEPELIRNFCIVAHVDHGKSTLADRLLEATGTIETSVDNAQVLDTLPVERQRGITIKAQTASMLFEAADKRTYLLNLIDTPGHVDFSYEVSRSLTACDGALLLVDASQGVQAQTVANFWMAFETVSAIVPVINKIDLKNAKTDSVLLELESLFDLNPSETLQVSAKLGTGVDSLLQAVVDRIPPPVCQPGAPLRALIFDSWFDKYRGCYVVVRIKDGHVRRGQMITAMHSGIQYEVQEVGVLHPTATPAPALLAGQVGYILANIRQPREARIGDTLRASEAQQVEPLAGFRQAKPMVFSGLFPVEPYDYELLKSALAKLTLTDPSVTLEPDQSAALGAGWRMGFLGVLHMEVFGQRLEDEFDVSTITTAPSVPYKAVLKENAGIRRRYDNKEEILILDPSKFPEPMDIKTFLEPLATCTVITPIQYYGQVLKLFETRRGTLKDETLIHDNRILIRFNVPLVEIIVDFISALKQITSGYGSFDYELAGYVETDLVKLSVLINGRPVEEFSRVVPRDDARSIGLQICQKLLTEIPRHQFDVPIQACIGSKIIARTTVKAMRKSFTSKLNKNFSERARLNKLLEHQREGKKRLKLLGDVEIPKEAFLNVLRKE